MIPSLISASPQAPADPAAPSVVIAPGAEAAWDLALLDLVPVEDGVVATEPVPTDIAAGVSVAPDPLREWLDRQSGLDAGVGADPQADAALRALADSLPALPDVLPTWTDEAIPDDTGAPIPTEGTPDAALPQAVAPMPSTADVAIDAPAAPRTDAIMPPPSVALPGDRRVEVGSTSAMPLAPVTVPVVARDQRMRPAAVSQPALPAAQPDLTVASSAPPLSQPLQPDPTSPPVAPPSPPLARPAADAASDKASVAASVRTAPPVAVAPNNTATEAPPPAIDPALPMQAPDQAPDARPSGDALMPATAARLAPVAPAVWQPAPVDPRPVVQQVAEAVITTREDRTEIALSPEELGRVRLILSGPDRAQITIWAERPETLDLLRRNADLLNQQLADAGVGSGSLDFRHDDRGTDPDPVTAAERDDDDLSPGAPMRTALTPSQLSDRRLDIRI